MPVRIGQQYRLCCLELFCASVGALTHCNGSAVVLTARLVDPSLLQRLRWASRSKRTRCASVSSTGNRSRLQPQPYLQLRAIRTRNRRAALALALALAGLAWLGLAWLGLTAVHATQCGVSSESVLEGMCVRMCISANVRVREPARYHVQLCNRHYCQRR
jgi:ferric-dicitrate binding protein FerR (iron transport regulator)